MAYENHYAIKQLFQKFFREAYADASPGDRLALEKQLEERLDTLLVDSANGAGTSFADLIGLGPKGVQPFGDLGYPRIKPDFDDSIVPSQLHAAAELYYIYQHERMKVFQVVQVLLRLFREGRMRIQRGPGARGLYLLEKWKPLRYTIRDRMIAYRRA